MARTYGRLAARVALVLYTLFLLSITLLLYPGHNPPPNLVPLRTMAIDWELGGRELLVNFVGNIVAFVPIGVLLPLSRAGRTGLGHAALYGLALSAGIEGLQYVSGLRVADVDDVILNTVGALIGFGLYRFAGGSGSGE